MPEVNDKFHEVYNRKWSMEDVEEMYLSFEKHLFTSLSDFTTPIPKVIDTLNSLRNEGILIGSTTGYTQAIMDIVRPEAEKRVITLII